MIERLAESDGLSAILPAMANCALALSLLGYSEKHPLLAEALGHLDGLLLRDEDGLRMQPCLSPVWDTVLAAHALLQGRLAPDDPAIARAVAWLLGKQTRSPATGPCATRRRPAAGTSKGRTSFTPTSTTPAWRSWCSPRRAPAARPRRAPRRSGAVSTG